MKKKTSKKCGKASSYIFVTYVPLFAVFKKSPSQINAVHVHKLVAEYHDMRRKFCLTAVERQSYR